MTDKDEALSFLRNLSEARAFDEDIDTLRERISAALDGYIFQTPIIPEKYVVSRARILASKILPKNLGEISFPPPAFVKTDHRAGRAGVSLFYCSNNNMTALHETRPISDQVAAISYWRCKRPLMIAALGYTQESLQNLGSIRNFAGWGQGNPRNSAVTSEWNDQTTKYLAKCFTRRPEDLSHNGYRGTIALAEMFLKQGLLYNGPAVNDSSSFDAIMYPSVERKGNSENFAIVPSTVLSALEPIRVETWHIRNRSPSAWELKLTNTSMSFDEDGTINWDAVPIDYWEADTAGGKLRFEFSKTEFITRNEKGEALKASTNI